MYGSGVWRQQANSLVVNLTKTRREQGGHRRDSINPDGGNQSTQQMETVTKGTESNHGTSKKEENKRTLRLHTDHSRTEREPTNKHHNKLPKIPADRPFSGDDVYPQRTAQTPSTLSLMVSWNFQLTLSTSMPNSLATTWQTLVWRPCPISVPPWLTSTVPSR